MSENKHRTRRHAFIISATALMLCLALVAVGVWALFTDEVTLTTHLQAGTLDIGLRRIGLTQVLPDEDGYLAETTSNTVVDFSEATDENVFGLKEEMLFVPCAYVEAEMQFVTENSTVAFDWYVKIVLTSAETDNDSALAEQLKVTVKTSDGETSAYLSEGAVGSLDEPIGTIARKDTGVSFTVKVEFVNDKVESSLVNNDAMNGSVEFDLIVYAVQKTTA